MDIREVIDGNVNGATFITLDTLTSVKLTGGKSNPFQGRVTKRVTGSNVMLFQNKNVNGYDAMVRRRLEQEGKESSNFELGPRAWGTREHGAPFVTHKDKLYLEVIFISAGTVEYLVDGEVYDGTIIGLERKQEGEQGGLENKVIIRTYAEESIQAITINHARYERWPLVGFLHIDRPQIIVQRDAA